MRSPFHFKKVLYLIEATGRSARRLEELLRMVLIAPDDTVGYHMHHEFLVSPRLLPEYSNDFADWAGRALGANRLCERLANLRVFKHRTLDSLKTELARLIADELSTVPGVSELAVSDERAFHFVTARSILLEAGPPAHDVEELRRAITQVEPGCLYYHLFETRFAGGARDGDLAEWLHGIGNPELAQRLALFDPYMFSLEDARRELLAMLPLASPAGGARK
jgi:hypothetical protein